MPFLAPASSEQTEQILDETFAQWGQGLGRGGYRRYNAAQLATPWGARCLQRLVLADGRGWVSTAKRYDLRGRLDGRDVRILGIGALFTPKALRGRGHAGELIRRMLDQAEGEGFGLALLFSEIGTAFYERLGFAAVPVDQFRLGVEPIDGPPAIPIRSGEARDIDAIAEMNVRQADGFRFAIARDAAYVHYAIAKKRLLAACSERPHNRVEFLVVEEGGRAAAYLVVLQSAASWMITECGDRDPSGARVGAMIQWLLQARPPGPARLRAWLPAGFVPPQACVLAREIPSLVMMLRPVGRSASPTRPLVATDLAYWHSDAF